MNAGMSGREEKLIDPSSAERPFEKCSEVLENGKARHSAAAVGSESCDTGRSLCLTGAAPFMSRLATPGVGSIDRADAAYTL